MSPPEDRLFADRLLDYRIRPRSLREDLERTLNDRTTVFGNECSSQAVYAANWPDLIDWYSRGQIPIIEELIRRRLQTWTAGTASVDVQSDLERQVFHVHFRWSSDPGYSWKVLLAPSTSLTFKVEEKK